MVSTGPAGGWVGALNLEEKFKHTNPEFKTTEIQIIRFIKSNLFWQAKDGGGRRGGERSGGRQRMP